MTSLKSSNEFLLVLKMTRKFYAEYKEERAQEEREAAEQGFRPHYCIHGTNQWVDYDNICYGCEEGVTLLRMACERAFGRVTEAHRRTDIVITAMNDLMHVPGVTMDRQVMIDWALAPVQL